MTEPPCCDTLTCGRDRDEDVTVGWRCGETLAGLSSTEEEEEVEGTKERRVEMLLDGGTAELCLCWSVEAASETQHRSDLNSFTSLSVSVTWSMCPFMLDFYQCMRRRASQLGSNCDLVVQHFWLSFVSGMSLGSIIITQLTTRWLRRGCDGRVPLKKSCSTTYSLGAKKYIYIHMEGMLGKWHLSLSGLFWFVSVAVSSLTIQKPLNAGKRCCRPEPGQDRPGVSSWPSIGPPSVWSSLDALAPSGQQTRH